VREALWIYARVWQIIKKANQTPVNFEKAASIVLYFFVKNTACMRVILSTVQMAQKLKPLLMSVCRITIDLDLDLQQVYISCSFDVHGCALHIPYYKAVPV
jgi:hypothetical protein